MKIGAGQVLLYAVLDHAEGPWTCPRGLVVPTIFVYKPWAIPRSSRFMPKNHDSEHKSVQVSQPEPPRSGGRQVEIFDAEDPRSLVNMVPGEVRKAIEALATGSEASLLAMDEQALKRRLKEEKRFLSATDNRIRLRFWDEYDRAQGEQRQITISHAFAGICTRQYFYQGYLKDPYRLAWLLCPPANYITIAEEALSFGLEQLRDILAMDDQEKDTKTGTLKLNLNLLKLKVKIVELLDQRLKGGIVQKSVQVNVGASAGDVNAAALGLTMEEMQRQMKELEKRERLATRGGALSPGDPVDAEIIAT